MSTTSTVIKLYLPLFDCYFVVFSDHSCSKDDQSCVEDDSAKLSLHLGIVTFNGTQTEKASGTVCLAGSLSLTDVAAVGSYFDGRDGSLRSSSGGRD